LDRRYLELRGIGEWAEVRLRSLCRSLSGMRRITLASASRRQNDPMWDEMAFIDVFVPHE
jgi:hypothetical protein